MKIAAARLLLASLVALAAAGCSDGADEEAPAAKQALVEVPGDAATIGEALDLVAEDGMVLVGPGTYREQVLVRTPGVTLRGTDRNAVVITGEGTRTAGVVGIADGVRVQNLTVTDTLLYGVLITGTHEGDEVLTPAEHGYDEFDPAAFPPLQRFRVDHVTATNNGLYGIYAFNTQHGVIADNWASGSADSGIYVGQCRDCDTLVQGNVTARNAVGFENANASDSLTVVGNQLSHNRVGMTLTSNYQEAFVPQHGNLVAGNVIADNDEPQSPEQADGGFGIGVGIAGGQDNVLVRNLITGNPLVGVLLDGAEDVPSTGNRIADNLLAGNGADVANVSLPAAATAGTCVVGPASLRLVPAGLGLGCAAGVDPAATSADLPQLSAPAGVAFLDVPRPGALPSMTDTRQAPTPLPATIERPAADAVRRPATDLLAAVLRAGGVR
ncbi:MULTISPECIES: nitrous oxide reductase family maturation protein NosD [unclassified Nocardioides]|uniref:right-handed parallel beta-helix repeat-containing protein n=1 Tax=unclassified Nocardioides TaxID=2615069 RepID=UPI0007034A69|nr:MULTISPECIES: NosD domain-containing protein [unclassified Nocardioides]KRC53381.1 hypothetical protein ASE19_13625 [Nocardioides sp. Root79]KRC68144.1 hypothetical protein ASE20_19130 [Nocardioides sp. Root240]